MKQVILISLLFIVATSQLVATQPEEEIQITVNADQPAPNSEKYFDKVFATDMNSFNILSPKFRSTITLVYNDNEEQATQDIQAIIDQLDPKSNKLDLLCVKMSIHEYKNATGIYIRHFEDQYYFQTASYSDIKAIISPSLRYVDNESDVDEFLSGQNIRALVLLNEDYEFKETVQSEIEKLIREGHLLESHISEIIGYRHSYKGYTAPTLLIYKPDYKLEQYEYNMTYVDQIVDFLYLESLPTLIPLNEDNYARVFGGPVQTQVHLLTDGNDEQLLKAFEVVAVNNKINDLKYERLLFCHSNYQDNRQLWNLFDFHESTPQPQLVITQTDFRKYQLVKYIADIQHYNTETIQEFVDNLRSHQLQEYYKSQPIPEIQGLVVQVVGKTFVEEVIKGKQNTLILYWDSKDTEACEQHLVLIDEISKVVDPSSLKVAKIDLAFNEHPKITIESAPKILLYLANDKKKPKEYLRSSELNVLEMSNWLKYWLGNQYKQVEDL